MGLLPLFWHPAQAGTGPSFLSGNYSDKREYHISLWTSQLLEIHEDVLAVEAHESETWAARAAGTSAILAPRGLDVLAEISLSSFHESFGDHLPVFLVRTGATILQILEDRLRGEEIHVGRPVFDSHLVVPASLDAFDIHNNDSIGGSVGQLKLFEEGLKLFPLPFVDREAPAKSSAKPFG